MFGTRHDMTEKVGHVKDTLEGPNTIFESWGELRLSSIQILEYLYSDYVVSEFSY